MSDPDQIVYITLPPGPIPPAGGAPAAAPPPPAPQPTRTRPPLDVRALTFIWDVIRIPLTVDDLYAKLRLRWLPRAAAFYVAHRQGLNSRRERKARLDKCASCRLRDGSFCRPTQQSCGCPSWPAAKITYRSWLRSWGCPLGHWLGEVSKSRVWLAGERVVAGLLVVSALLGAAYLFTR